MTFPSYDIQTETANGVVDLSKLHAELEQGASGGFIGVQSNCEVMSLTYDPEPAEATKIVIDGIVATHDGIPTLDPVFKASAMVVPSEKSIVGASFAEVGAFVVDPSLFAYDDSDLSNMFFKIVGLLETNGTVELQITENGEAVISAIYSHGDTGLVCEDFAFQSNTEPTSGRHEYKIEARLGSATEAKVHHATMGVWELK